MCGVMVYWGREGGERERERERERDMPTTVFFFTIYCAKTVKIMLLRIFSDHCI